MRYVLSFFIFVFFALSCANKAIPPGGTPIETPPKVISTWPQQGAVNVKVDSIIHISFSEHMNRRVTQNSIVFYPFFERYIEYNWSGNKDLFIKPDTTLRENFVHFVNIESNARDVYNNTLEPSFTLIFSTGDTIHSNSIEGKVFRDDMSAAPNVKLYLFKSIPNDTNIFSLRNLQYGFTETDREGKFSFGYIEKGKYLIVGLEDLNRNFVKEDNELIALSSDTIDMFFTKDSTLNDINLFLFKEPQKISLLSASARFNNRYTITLNSKFDFSANELSRLINFVNISDSSIHKVTVDTMFYRPNTDELTVFAQMPFDTIQRIKIEIDSAQAQDILKKRRSLEVDSLNFERTLFYYNSKDTIPLVVTSITPQTNSFSSIFTPLIIDFNKPIFINNSSLISAYFQTDTSDTGTIADTLDKKINIDNGYSLSISSIADYKIHKEGFITIAILPEAISDYSGNFNRDTIEVFHTLVPEDRTGSINFTLEGVKKKYLDNISLKLFLSPVNRQNSLRKEKIYLENISGNNFSITGIQEGSYKITGFIDRDKTGELSHGSLNNENFYSDIIFTGSDSLRVRAGWSTDDTLRGYF